MEGWCLNHWTPREVLKGVFLRCFATSFPQPLQTEGQDESRAWWENIKWRLLNGSTDFVTTQENEPKPLHLERHRGGEGALWSLLFEAISGSVFLFVKEHPLGPSCKLLRVLWIQTQPTITPGRAAERQRGWPRCCTFHAEDLQMSITLVRWTNCRHRQQNSRELTGGPSETKHWT